MNHFFRQIARTGTKNMKNLTKVITDHLSLFLAGRITAEGARFRQQSENSSLAFVGREEDFQHRSHGKWLNGEPEHNSSPTGVILE